MDEQEDPNDCKVAGLISVIIHLIAVPWIVLIVKHVMPDRLWHVAVPSLVGVCIITLLLLTAFIDSKIKK